MLWVILSHAKHLRPKDTLTQQLQHSYDMRDKVSQINSGGITNLAHMRLANQPKQRMAKVTVKVLPISYNA